MDSTFLFFNPSLPSPLKDNCLDENYSPAPSPTRTPIQPFPSLPAQRQLFRWELLPGPPPPPAPPYNPSLPSPLKDNCLDENYSPAPSPTRTSIQIPSIPKLKIWRINTNKFPFN